MKSHFLVSAALVGLLLIASCGGDSKTSTAGSDATNSAAENSEKNSSDPAAYDPKRGEGKYNADNVSGGPLDANMAVKGEAVAGTKCFACHKASDEKLVGPGWKGVTARRTLYWIMNFITNPDPMIEKDPEVQAQLELCLVRMPNQNLSEDEAKQVLEYMRKNDGAK